MLINCFLVLVLVICVCRCEDERPRVSTPSGDVVGYVKTSFHGRKFAAYEGIPYARPPIGKRRFKPPERRAYWEGDWDARYLTECIQPDRLQLNVTKGSEDCLYINVYAPIVEPDLQDTVSDLAVIVQIHGGGFLIGSGHMLGRPEYLLDKDIVFVTFNYRLGIFGFLSTEDDVVSGNNGLKDQVRALEWIQKNIKSFGGNPSSVTLVGISAGGASVHLHYFSLLSQGLFHRGYSMGGVALNPWTFQENALEKTQRLAAAVGCPTSPNKELVKCLKQKPAQQLIRQLPLFGPSSNVLVSPFGPTLEKGSNAFIKTDPYTLLQEGHVNDLPWVVSNAADEGALFSYLVEDGLEPILQQWETEAPTLLQFNYTLPQTSWSSVTQRIKDFYLGNTVETNEENVSKFLRIFADRLFLFGAENAVRLQSKVVKSPIYYYYFNYAPDKTTKVVSHVSDAQYLFGRFFDPTPLKTQSEIKMKEVLLGLLIYYARVGKPVIQGVNWGVNWEPTKSDKLTYINMEGFDIETIKLKTVDELTPREFWKSLGIAEDENIVKENNKKDKSDEDDKKQDKKGKAKEDKEEL